jgi:5-methylcytosine-specific restriction endonuclease McrA
MGDVMSVRSLTLVPDHVLLQELKALVSNHRALTAALLAHLGECDARKLYRPQGYPSMHAYCVGHLHFSEESAYKRIQVARAARSFPEVLSAIAMNQVHVTGLVLLAPHMTRENCAVLLAKASHRTAAEIRVIVAEIAPRPDVPTRLIPVVEAPSPSSQPAPEPVDGSPKGSEEKAPQLDSNPVGVLAEAAPVPATPPARLRPLAPERFAFQVTLSQETRDIMKEAQDAVGSAIASNDYDALLCAAFKALIAQKRHERFAETSKPRAGRGSSDPRYVKASIKREVHERDGGQCAFVSDNGKRCECKRDLEFDHVIPVAKGGLTTASNLRLLCRAHNQYEAERVLGQGFMKEKHDNNTQDRSRPSTSGTPGTRT